MPSRRRGQPAHQVVDPAVSRVKFARELKFARALEDEYRRRGCILLRTDFPVVELLFGVPHLQPSPVLFGALLDFTNYDAEPPSVRVIHPWTQAPLHAAECPTPLPVLDDPQKPRFLLQAWTASEDIPFVCTPGVREYHRHPGHTGDSWWLRRGRGEGTLPHVLEVLTTHGPDAVAAYLCHLDIQQSSAGVHVGGIHISGFQFRSKLRASPAQLPLPLPVPAGAP